ncbi:MAG: phosphodiester glycosidase family protein [Verrucomicrobiaceae bacterium]|nr:phosphodiester glycosidase family protein [Verrucomicrobiaceae bacterium]
MALPSFRLIKWFLMLALIAGVGAYVAGESVFNLSSNFVAVTVKDSKTPFELRTKKGGWKKLPDASAAELQAALVERHKEDGLRWSSLAVRRQPDGFLQRFSQGLFGAEVNVISIAPDKFDFQTTFLPKFAVTTAAERMAAEELWFAITANFRDPDGKPLGWVYHEGREVHGPFPAWKGCFFVKGGKPFFGPKSLLDSVPGPIEEGTQGYPSVMKDHTVFPYVDLAPNKFFDGSKLTYRALAGMKRDGTIVFVLSGDGSVMSVGEVTDIARKLDVQHATLLDGGRALQYSIRTESGARHFHAFNTTLNFKHAWLERQRSPVFIGVRRKAPRIVTPGRTEAR